MNFADIHTHALYGSDDGAKSREQMLEIVAAAYADGARCMCLTPHYHPGYYGDNRDASAAAFAELTEYAENAFPDLELAIANELHYAPNCVAWLRDGQCRTVAGSRFVLVDFSEGEDADNIVDGLFRILNLGYRPILAHAERYDKLKRGHLEKIKFHGCLIQINAGSLFGDFGRHAKKMAKTAISLRLADFISSDVHNMTTRPPGMGKCYDLIKQKYSEEYANALCYENAKQLFFNKQGKD